MSIYKVLLADDEEDVRHTIAKKIDWASLGFELIGEAENGVEAFEIAEQLSPDVLITDIKMPFMDGLELCRRVRRRLPGIRIAVFSGFDEFEYARGAIAQQVQEYILKPIDTGELSAVLTRMHQSLDREISERLNMERLRQYYEESFPLMRQQLLLDLLEGRTDPAASGSEYGLNLDAAAYCAAVVRLRTDDMKRDPEEENLLLFSLQQLIPDILSKDTPCHLIRTTRRIVLLLLLQNDDYRQTQPGDLLEPLFPGAKKLLGVNLSIGVGGVYKERGKISASYAEAQRALEYQILIKPGQCIRIGDIEPGSEHRQGVDPVYSQELLKQIKTGDRYQLEQAVSSLVGQLKSSNTGIRQYQIFMMELATELLKLVRGYRLGEDEIDLDELLLGGQLTRSSSMEELSVRLFSVCDNLRRVIRLKHKDSVRLMIEKAKEILRENYADSSLSLDSVCEIMRVSPAYFSTLFKKETGDGFVSYLTGLRMEKALELLANTDDKTYQIAEKAGYADPNYFSYVFKRQFGVSPSKYRTDGVQSNNGHQ